MDRFVYCLKDTNNYTYDTTHKNRLLSYNGELCSNYVLGNPNTYRGKTAVWTKVHRLASLGNVSFEYDYAGIRTKKTVNGITTKYGINGSTIVSEQKGADTTRINYYYGYNGLTGFKYLGNCYYYKKNIFGDIIGIYDDNDDLIVRYVYDAWGNHIVLNPDGTENTSTTFIGNINPFRYRSYYFDTETGFYYLQSRYYDPQVGRFISMDAVEYLDPEIINGFNLYAYCGNDPIANIDPNGTFGFKLACVVISVVVSVAAVAIEDLKDGQIGNDVDKKQYLGAAVSGLISGIAGGPVSSVILGVVGDVAKSAITGELNKNNIAETFVTSAISNTVGVFIGSKMGNLARKGAANIKANQIIKMKGRISNNIINRELKPIANNLNIGAKKATKKGLVMQYLKLIRGKRVIKFKIL